MSVRGEPVGDTSRTIEAGRYHRLLVDDCPIAVLARVARDVGFVATVENARPVREWNSWFESSQAIFPGGPASDYRLRNVQMDVAMSNERFLEHLPWWDRHGVFVVFAERGPIPFRASDLEGRARHRALDNFGDWLVVALPGPSGDSGCEIVATRGEWIDGALEAFEAG